MNHELVQLLLNGVLGGVGGLGFIALLSLTTIGLQSEAQKLRNRRKVSR